jgi:glycosyltransferase involved in cell wall biosynthesis
MLSIIIPTLNEEKYLPRLLECIKDQSFQDYEIIVSDGSSEDRTLEIAEKNACRTAKTDRRHPSIQRNEGAKISRGDILLFLDADTLLSDNLFLERSLKEFRERNIGVAGFRLSFKSKKPFYIFSKCFYNNIAFLAQYFKPIAVGAGIMVEKKIHDEIGGFDEGVFIGEDHFYCEQASKTKKFRLIKKAKIFFSERRFEKEGKWKVFKKLLKASFYVILFGPIKKKIVSYDFGDYS